MHSLEAYKCHYNYSVVTPVEQLTGVHQGWLNLSLYFIHYNLHVKSLHEMELKIKCSIELYLPCALGLHPYNGCI